jgi:hypothetical protein
VLLAVVALAGLGMHFHNQSVVRDSIKRMKNAVTRDFHDPESARFRNVELKSMQTPVLARLQDPKLYGAAWVALWDAPGKLPSIFFYDPQGFVLCGEVNAKNAFGAYVGYKLFHVLGSERPIAFIDSELAHLAKEMCGTFSNVIYSEPSLD